jgi:hypothetical protein
MSGRVGRLLAASILLAACDVDFVAVERGIPGGHVTLRGDHGTAFEASLDMRLPDEGTPPFVVLEGLPLQGEPEDGGWRYRGTVPVDSLQPQLELGIQGREHLALLLPLATRSGPGVWLQDGDLALPVVYGGDAGAPELSWRVELVDSTGRQLVRIEANGAPLPSPLVLPLDLVAEGTVAAEVTASLQRSITEDEYRLSVVIRSNVRIPIPGGG